MIALGELTLKSGLKFQVEVHTVKIFQLSILHGGSFKMTDAIRSQLKKDAKAAGSWQAVREMNIKFNRLDITFDVDILVKDIFTDYPEFNVVKEFIL